MTNGVTPGNATVTHLAFIRGTAAEIAAVNGSPGNAWNVGEPVWDITNNILWIAKSPGEVVPIGPATNLPLTDYVHRINNNTISGANIFLGQTDLKGPTYLGARLNGQSNEYYPAISDQSGGGTLLPASDSTSKLATTAWVQRHIANLPGDVARRGAPNTFTQANEFTGTIVVPTVSATGPYDGKAASTLFVQQYVNQLGGVWARLNNSNLFTAGTHDFTATAGLLGPTPAGTWANASTGSTTIPTIGWLKTHLPTGSALLTSNNVWLGNNSYSLIPTIGPAVPQGDNSNKIPTTSWVQFTVSQAVAAAISSGVPVLSKSLIDPSTLDWTSGSVVINGVSVPVSAGSYNYVTPGVYYVKVNNGGVVNPNPTTPELSVGEYLLGNVSVVIVGTDVEISTVINTPAPINYAIRNANNTFSRDNTFTGDVLIRIGGAANTIPAAFMATSNGIDFNVIPRGNYNLTGANENNRSLATTEWVTSKLSMAGGGFFEQTTAGNIRLKSAITGCLDLTANCLRAPHPNANDNSNNVPTTAWVQAYVSGIPIAPQLSPGQGLNVNYTSGMVKTPATSPCSGSRCINGECNIPAGSIPINPTTKYVYVRYADCAMIASDAPMPANQYHFLGDVLVEGNGTTGWVVTIINAPTGNWAPINSPNFVGNPTAPHPLPNDDDNSIPTTAWVRDRVESFVCPPPPTNRPRVVDGGGLNINVTAGEIVSPGAAVPDCQVSPLPNPLAVNASSTEYIWIRYADCKVVASTFRPVDGHGDIIGIVVSNQDDIVSITQVGAAMGSINTCLTGHYGVGFGGYLVYSPYEIG